MKPLITALIDTYNHEKYIEQTLESVIEQGLSPSELEIIVVDDGSTDGTAGLIRKFGSRVKHIRKKNGGQASAFNAGFAESRGETIALLDGDDWWERGKLVAVAEALERNPDVAAVGHGYFEHHEQTGHSKVVVSPAKKVLGIETAERAQAALTVWPFLLMGALTVRRKVMESINPIPEEMTFMADTAIQVAAMVMGTVILEQPLFYYRYHAQNLYAVDPNNAEKMRRRCEMTEIAHSRVYQMMIDLGIPKESLSMLLEGSWMDAKRKRLSMFGGKRIETFETEMQCLRLASAKAGVAYRLFKYFVVAPATLLLSPQRFYGLRNWYADRDLGRYREKVVREER
jgi:glycosyltransferase involved in cell wall biosynthesis